MRILAYLLFLTLSVIRGAADTPIQQPPPAAAPMGILILKNVPGYPEAATSFVSIQWVNNDGGYVVKPDGSKLAFVNIGVGKIIYFNQLYYDELNHNSSWLDWRAGIQNQEVVIAPPDPDSIFPEALPHLQAEKQQVETIIAVYPLGKPATDPLLASITDACTKLSSGLVLQKGKWVSAKDAEPPPAVPTIGGGDNLTTFTTKDGKKYENVTVQVTDTGLSVVTATGGVSVPFDQLPDDLSAFPEAVRTEIQETQAKISQQKSTAATAASSSSSTATGSGLWGSMESSMESLFHHLTSSFSSSTPTSSPTAATPSGTETPSPFAASLSGKLVSLDGTALPTPSSSVHYYAIYYSAQWCPPCHAFSPQLVKWYNKFKPSHPDFELIFVSEDHDGSAMLDYMKEMAMPWPAVRFSDLKHDGNNTFKGSGIEKYAGTGIPDLVLVDASGNVLSDSFQGTQYLGPETVVNDINRIAGGPTPVAFGQ